MKIANQFKGTTYSLSGPKKLNNAKKWRASKVLGKVINPFKKLSRFNNYITKFERNIVSTPSLHGRDRVKVYQILEEHLFSITVRNGCTSDKPRPLPSNISQQ